MDYITNGNAKNKKEGREVKDMTSTLLEQERINYINGMKKYLEELKNMPKDKAKKIARDTLHKSGVLTKKGDLTAHYRKNLEHKE